jgi:TolB-like protein/class 3 adenylate cyclase/TPR repeat protein
MTEKRKLAAILAADVVGFSRLTGSDEEGTLAVLRTLWSDLIAPTVAMHHGRVVKRTGDGSIIEFRSVVDAVRCAIEVQNGTVERNAGLPPERRIEFRIGIHLGDVVEEGDGDLMGDGVNIAARLEGTAHPGGICLSEDAYRQVRDRLKEGFIDLGEKELKNIARPVRAYAIKSGSTGLASETFGPAPHKAGPPRLSIVVRPFANIGGDPQQEYFVDGVTESLTTDLSRITGSFVIARNTAFTYKGNPFDVKQIGRDLNVRYVLEGSVQRSGSRLRVNVQLIDAETATHLWAERFDKSVADLFEMQDEIVARLANSLKAQLIVVEARRAERAPSPDSMDLYFQAMAWFNRGATRETLTRARTLFERASALDPSNVDAETNVAVIDAVMAAIHAADDRAERFAAAETSLTKLLLLAPNNAWMHFWMGHIKNFTNRAAQAIAEFQRAVALDPNLALAHAQIGLAELHLGRAEKTEGHVLEALRLSPRDTWAYVWQHFVGVAELGLDADEKAVVWYRRSIESNGNFSLSHLYLAAALAQRGRLEEAQAEVKAGLGLDPKFTLRRFRAGPASDNPKFLALLERLYDGMRKAGVPEG